MDRRVLKLNSEVLGGLYDNYLKRVEDISTLYAVVKFTELNIGNGIELIGEDVEIPLSSNFSSGFTTVINKNDIVSCSISGALHQTNCYQVVVSLVSNFEILIDALVDLCGISSRFADKVEVSVYGKSISSPILKKIKAIHERLAISSNVIGDHELQYYYKIILIRNRIVHMHGRIKDGDEHSLSQWVKNRKVTFTNDHIDDFIHFFLMPLTSMVTAIDEKMETDLVV